MRRAPKTMLATGTFVALAFLTACSGGGGGGSSADSASAGSGLAAKAVPSAGGEVADGAVAADRAAVQTKAVIRTAEISLTSKEIDRVRAEVERLLEAVGGTIDGDRASTDRKGRTDSATMTLRVPVAAFDATMTSIEKLGTLKSSDQQGKDVTTQVIDVDERVKTLQNSLDRLHKFQREATDVADLLRYEDQITARTAELQSLQGQQAYLHDQTSMSTITLTLSTPAKYVAPPDPLRDAGFLAGLEGGWNALTDTLVVMLTVLGALLPFLIVIALLGVPSYLGVRTVLRRRRAAADATAG